MSFLNKIFADANARTVKELTPAIAQINSLEKEFESFSSEQLKEKTNEFKERLDKGASLEEILPEAFALVREASKRTLGQRHFDVQMIVGIVLHQGKIAEMKTGEGKTLAATLPLYLNALEGKGCHLITVNEYLVKRDTVWMGQIYHILGLTVGCLTHESSYIYDPGYEKPQISISKSQTNPKLSSFAKATEDKQIPNGERDKERDTVGGFKVIESYLRPCTKKESYAADITYGTNSEFGFYYLRDNMVFDLNEQVQRGFNYAIIDEVDSILIDEARTPLIISAPDVESSQWYREFARLIPQLEKDADYQIDEKMRAATLTEAGINRIEKILQLENIYEEKGMKYLHYLEQALRAETLFRRDKDYMVKDGEVIIVDEFTGRLLPGRRYSGGLHQAIEAKENVLVQPESLTLASISFQNYFRMYKKLAGMTGTALTSAEEFDKVYKLEVAAIPTNKPMIRRDLPDRVYKTERGKFKALVKEIKERYEKGQPVLMGTTSIEKNELLGKMLEMDGVPHQILNAKHHEQEGAIIAQAGKYQAVTVATNMAGRGVDIILGGNPPVPEEAQKVKELGGLHVIGTERHEARRIDNQLRGRSGRQGDAGSSQFFISLEDTLMRIFGGDRLKSLMEMLKIPEDEPIEANLVSNAIEEAQAKIEGFNFDSRKHLLEYDDVMNKHREIFYKKRREILEAGQISDINDPAGLRIKILKMIENAGLSKEEYEKKEKEVGPENMRQIEKALSLRILDFSWTEHLENMEYLVDSVRLRAYGQKDPLIEYKNEGHKMFQKLISGVENAIAETILKVRLNPAVALTETRTVAAPAGKIPGRNDPCPCGAKKPDGRPVKYKHCHGK